MLEAFVPVNTTHFAGNVSMYLVIFLLFTVACVFAQYHWRRRRLYTMAAKIPGPPTVPMFGNSHMFIGVNDSKGIYHKVTGLIKRYMDYLKNGPLRLWMGPTLTIVIGKPEDLQIVLTASQSMDKSVDFYKCLYPIMGVAPLLYKSVKQWKLHRKIFQVPLTKIKCYEYVSEFQSICDDFMEDLDATIKEGMTALKLGKLIDCIMIRTVCCSLMGVETGDYNRLGTFLEAARWLLDVEFQRMCKMWLHNDFVFKFTKLYQLEVSHIDAAARFIDWILETRRETRAKNKRLRAKNLEVNDEKRLLDIFLDMRENGEYSEREVRDEVVLFFGAGMDTTAFSLHMTLLLIAMNPEVQQKLYEELYGIFGDSERPVEADDIREMKYLDMVIKESIRIYTPIPVTARYVTEDLKLENYVIPAESVILVAPYAVHHNPEIYPNPSKFDPERFHPDNKRHPYSYIPFSGGPRNCIGYTFAFVLMKMMIAMVVRKYKLSTDCTTSDIRIKLTLTAKVSAAKPIIFEERKKNMAA